MARPGKTYLLGIVGVSAFGLLLSLCGNLWTPQPAQADRLTPSSSTPGPREEDGFAGDNSCVECHRKEFTEHKGSRHDMTLRPATVQALGSLIPPTGPIGGTAYTITREGDRFSFGQKNGKKQPVGLAFGSGKTGMTYVTVGRDQKQTEFRMSRMPPNKDWYITPGQESMGDIDLGLVHSTKMTGRCIGCHANYTPTNPARITEKMFGVGCESCHGPSRAHIDAARIKGNTDLKIERMSQWTPKQINKLCAKCHRSQDDVSLVTRDASSTQRFQPYGLELSPCFRKSGGKISCATCHNSHTDVTHDQKSYERVCITCHTPPKMAFTPDPRVPKDAIRGKGPCPVNPKEKCVSCHMPSTQIFPGSKLPVKMADHMIWAYGKKRIR